MCLGLADFPTNEHVHVVGPVGVTFLRQRAAHLKADLSVSRGASTSSVPLLPLLQVLLRLMVVVLLLLIFLHRLLRMIQTSDVRWIMSWPFRRLKDRFWWTFWMRLEDCKEIWHGFEVLHHHLLLMMVCDCPLAFHHKKGEYTYEMFLAYLYLFLFLRGEFIFIGWSLWSCLDCI